MARTKRKQQRGMTLLELIFSLTILTVGLIGILSLIMTAIASNNRAKMDTTATWMAEKVLESIISQPANLNTSFNITDCNPAGNYTWIINTAGAASPGAGPPLDNTTGGINWAAMSYAASPDGYKMRYVTCGANNEQVTYDVRWNIQNLSTYSKLVTVSARPLGARVPVTGTQPRFFATPVTVRTIVSTQ